MRNLTIEVGGGMNNSMRACNSKNQIDVLKLIELKGVSAKSFVELAKFVAKRPKDKQKADLDWFCGVKLAQIYDAIEVAVSLANEGYELI